MKTKKLTPVEWLLNELDQRDMIDKTIYRKKYRTFEVIKKKALNMEEDYECIHNEKKTKTMKTAEEILKKHYPSLVRQEDEFGLASIYEAMEEYASQSKWISVEDKLPNKKGFYLCLMKESDDVVDCMYYDNETWWGSEEIYNNSEILLWQPLPQPPSNN